MINLNITIYLQITKFFFLFFSDLFFLNLKKILITVTFETNKKNQQVAKRQMPRVGNIDSICSHLQHLRSKNFDRKSTILSSFLGSFILKNDCNKFIVLNKNLTSLMTQHFGFMNSSLQRNMA